MSLNSPDDWEILRQLNDSSHGQGCHARAQAGMVILGGESTAVLTFQEGCFLQGSCCPDSVYVCFFLQAAIALAA